jgi:hypothetical protein
MLSTFMVNTIFVTQGRLPISFIDSNPAESELNRVLVIHCKNLLAAGIPSLLNREMDLYVFDAIEQVCNPA